VLRKPQLAYRFDSNHQLLPHLIQILYYKIELSKINWD